MYYDNKFGFYIKEYGTKIIIGIVVLIVALSGLFIHLKLNDNNNNVTAEKNEPNVQENVVEDDSKLPEELRALAPGDKITAKVTKVDGNGVIVFVTDTYNFEGKLYGVSYEQIEGDSYYSLNNDLVGKTVEVSFDENKVKGGYASVYVYTNDTTLYNAEYLKSGKAVLDNSTNKKSIEYVSLAEAQAYAKQTLAGVWAY